jgi:hypothetical protein
MDKEKVTSQSLMTNASSYYTNLVASGNWKLEINKHAQIIALTTQILELKSEISQVKTSTKPSGDTGKVLHNKNDNFQRWHLTKIKLTMVTYLTWLIRMALSTIGVISTSILIVNSQGCMFSINQWIMMNARKRRTFSTLGKRAMANLPL